MNETYGIFKKFANDNHYVSFAKNVSSAHTTKATKATLKRLHDEFGHYSQLVIHNGICYVCFIHNIGSRGDNQYQSTLSLTHAIFSLDRVLSDDFDYKKDVSLHRFGSIGDTFAGHKALSSMTCPSMLLIGDMLYTTVGFLSEIENQWSMFASVYDTNKKEYVSEYEMKLCYKDKVGPFNNDTINEICKGEGYVRNSRSSMINTSNRWCEYDGEYYTAFHVDIPGGSNGMIVKTKDFKTLNFVSIIPEIPQGRAETAIYIFDKKLYIAARQPWGTPYLLLSRYDFETGEWKEPYKVEDGNARPWMFEYHGELYLFNTIEEVGEGRRFSNISKIRTCKGAHNDKNAPVDVVATLFECGHHYSCFVYDDRIFFSCSYKGQGVVFGELKLKQYSPEKINDKLIELFGEE